MSRSTIYTSLFASILFLILPSVHPTKGDRLPVLPSEIEALTISETDQYCNTRFNFCVDFPAEIFTNKELSNNGDGAIFSSPNKEVVMNISGAFNVLNRSIQEQMELLFAAIETPVHDIADHATIISEDHFISLVEQDAREVYIRSHKYDNYFVNIIVKINDKNYLKGKNLDDEIKLVVST